MFKDRKDAGQKLAEALNAYMKKEPLVLAIPRGGVPVGYQVARHLESEFSVIVVRKLPLPDNPEAGFGAIAEDGSTYFVTRARELLPSSTIEQVVKEQKLEIKRRIDVLRKGKSLPEINNKTVILVDDGIAMGSTMRAAVTLCKNNNAAKIIAAAPVAGPSAVADIAKLVDQVVVLEKPLFFRAVAEVYENWYDVPDEEVVQIMHEYQRHEHRT